MPRHRARTGSVSQGTSFNLYKLLLRELAIPQDGDTQKSQYNVNQLITNNESYEQIMNMVKLPFHLERIMCFGLLSCFNSFLRVLVILPLKLVVDSSLLILSIRQCFIHKKDPMTYIKMINFKDVVYFSMIMVALFLANVDTSKIYHTIRAQSSIKLYVMFGVLEISDKLLSTVGQDLLNFIFTFKLSYNNDGSIRISSITNFITFYFLGLCYLSIHTIILIYQTISLNVAANSYSNSLVTLLLSNQFAEIKSSVFKKIDREGLFQMTCSDVVERFQLVIMLTIISLKNIVQLDSSSSLLPNSSFKGMNRWFGLVLGPSFIVIGSEILVDWLKHAYTTKFNKIKPKVYNRFLSILSNDTITSFKTGDYNNTDSIMERRIGLPLIALVVLFVVMCKDSIAWMILDNDDGKMIWTNFIVLVFVFILLVIVKLLAELALLKWSNHIIKAGFKEKEVERVASRKESSDYVEGVVSGGMGAMDEDSRLKMYEGEDTVPSSLNDKRDFVDDDKKLQSVMRYRMSSKRIY